MNHQHMNLENAISLNKIERNDSCLEDIFSSAFAAITEKVIFVITAVVSSRITYIPTVITMVYVCLNKPSHPSLF